MREKLADLCHRQWSGWMEYLFSKCSSNPDNSLTIPVWAVVRWTRQMATEYEQLFEDEKESDRKEADRFISLLADENNLSHSGEGPACEVAESCPVHRCRECRRYYDDLYELT
jgi:hypothetical protein